MYGKIALCYVIGNMISGARICAAAVATTHQQLVKVRPRKCALR
jgi:hypothetical protein